MTAVVIPIQSARESTAHVLSDEQRASLLLTVARTWDDLVQVLGGSGRLSHDDAELAAQALARPLVHPAARAAAGVFLLPELRRLVKAADALQADDDARCHTLADAIEDTQRDLDGTLWLLLSGIELRRACRGCRDTAAVHSWRVQGHCPDHRPGAR